MRLVCSDSDGRLIQYCLGVARSSSIVDAAEFIAGDCWQTKMLLSSRAQCDSSVRQGHSIGVSH